MQRRLPSGLSAGVDALVERIYAATAFAGSAAAAAAVNTN